MDRTKGIFTRASPLRKDFLIETLSFSAVHYLAHTSSLQRVECALKVWPPISETSYIYLFIYIKISSVCVYVTELLLNGLIDIDEMFYVFSGGLENGLDLQFGPI